MTSKLVNEKIQSFVEKYIDKPWHWGGCGLSSNPIITPEFVERFHDKPWEWGKNGLSSNPSITPEFVEKFHGKPWDWGKYGLSSNSMYIGIQRQVRKKIRNSAARIIQKKYLE